MTVARTRERDAELLGLLAPAELRARADAIGAAGAELVLLRAPEVGSVVVQVREPIAQQRFQLADLTVTTAEVSVAGERGWAMRAGSDPHTAVAQAICEAELARGGEHAHELRALLDDADRRRSEEREREWQRIAATIVEFEEVM